MERGWAKREREHEARGDMGGRKREKQEEVKGRRGRGQRKKKRGEEEREEERETTRTNLELPMDVAADRHGAPHRRDVGLGGEDLAGHVAERLFGEKEKREEKRSGLREGVSVVVLVIRRSIAVEKRHHLLSFSPLSLPAQQRTLTSGSGSGLHRSSRSICASSCAHAVASGKAGGADSPFLGGLFSLSRLSRLSFKARGARVPPPLSPSLVRGAVPQERRLANVCPHALCGWPPESLPREGRTLGVEREVGVRCKFLMGVSVAPFSLSLACLLRSHAGLE